MNVRAIVVAAAGWLVAALAAPSAAIASAPSRGDERVGYIARQLERSPLYVSDTLARVVPAADVRRLWARLRAVPSPTYLAIVPSNDPFRDPVANNELAGLLRSRIRRPGIYMTIDENGYAGSIVTFGGVTTLLEPGQIELALLEDVPRRAGPAARAQYALELLRTGRRSAEGEGDDGRLRLDGLGILVVTLLVFCGLTVPWARARRRSRPPVARRRRTPPAPAAVAPPTGQRQQAMAALGALSSAIESADDPPPAALDAYAAASKLLEQEHRAIDDVGAFALAAGGLAALQGHDRRPCFFNPLHTGRRRMTRWRLRDEDAAIPACTRCARALKRGRQPQSLADGDEPYWRRDTIWARTGFGAIDDELAERVLRGEALR